MSTMYQHLTPDYQEKVLKRWEGVLDAGQKIDNEQVRVSTAIVLENTQRDFEKPTFSESYTNPSQAGAMGANAGNVANVGGGALGSAFDFGVNDARIPTIVIPTVKRIFPYLLAHNVVGVQPMNGPVGFAFALRALYGINGKGGAYGAPENTEIGYNRLDSAFTGASGNSGSGSYWEAYAGTAGPPTSANFANEDGKGATLTDSEWWNIGADMPMAKFRMEKGVVYAIARKLAAHWSLELAEDMMNMHGVDVDSEMVNIISYEIQAEIDRELLSEMVKAAIAGSNTSTWSPVSADGRDQLQRISTLYTHILDKANDIAINTRRGPASFAIASPKVSAIVERLQDFVTDVAANPAVDTSNIGIAKVGVLRNGGISMYRDTFAGGNYILLGYKGPTPYDSGIIYCPYIPVQLMRAVGQENFTPRIGVRTRYGLLANMFGSSNYYHLIAVNDLTNVLLAADGGRVFTY